MTSAGTVTGWGSPAGPTGRRAMWPGGAIPRRSWSCGRRAAVRAAGPLAAEPGGDGAVGAGTVQLRLVWLPVRGQPPAVPRPRGVAVLHAGARSRRLAPGPGAYPGPR